MDTGLFLILFIMVTMFFFSSLGYLIGRAKKDQNRQSRNLKRMVVALVTIFLSLFFSCFLPDKADASQTLKAFGQEIRHHQTSISRQKSSLNLDYFAQLLRKDSTQADHDYPAIDVPIDQDYVEVNGNRPFFSEQDLLEVEPYHEKGSLDSLGRVTAANALLDETLMPAEERGDIGYIEPTGWKQRRYTNISGGWLYNRSHLIGYQLTGDDSPENLMTGTRAFNETMIPFENFVAAYVEGGGLVRYRVTPVFEGAQLLASGVYMEGYSLDDGGESLCFNIYIPNRQEGIRLNYADGSSQGPAGPIEEELDLAPPVLQKEKAKGSKGRGSIKGNISSSGEKIYHMPGQKNYERTKIDPSKGERWFETEEEAQAAGWRRAKR